MKNDLRYGKGILYSKHGWKEYVGDWINNKFEGYGIYIFEDGTYYEGEFINSLRKGN